jgi:hypothetical protein
MFFFNNNFKILKFIINLEKRSRVDRFSKGVLSFENLSFSLISLIPFVKCIKQAPGRGGFYPSRMRTRKAVKGTSILARLIATYK